MVAYKDVTSINIFFKAASVNIRVILKENCEHYDCFWNYHINENSSVHVPKKQI